MEREKSENRESIFLNKNEFPYINFLIDKIKKVVLYFFC